MAQKTPLEIETYLRERGIPCEVFAPKDNSFIDVNIEWGDWKHDHIYCDELMAELGYYLSSECETDEDGSDCYSSTHHYLLAINNLYEIFDDKFDTETHNVDIKTEDDLYSYAHAKFMQYANEIQKKWAISSDELDDGQEWYDEYHDEIVELYCKKLTN